MRVFAPGKLVLTGAYAVLEGAPAIVMATSRGATADSARSATQLTPEVRAALGEGGARAPFVDAAALFEGERKLGLGASAAILVASLGLLAVAEGSDLGGPSLRARLFAQARAAHAAAQSGGSGVDVAASVWGGVLRYTTTGDARGSHQRVMLPPSTHITVFRSGTSARTTELRTAVDRLAVERPAIHRTRMDELAAIAHEASRAVGAGDPARFIGAIHASVTSLARLGQAAEVPIVPPGHETLALEAAREGAAFCPSGAGGGDVSVFVGVAAPTQDFLERARALGLYVLDLCLDEKGVRIAPHAAAHAATTACVLTNET